MLFTIIFLTILAILLYLYFVKGMYLSLFWLNHSNSTDNFFSYASDYIENVCKTMDDIVDDEKENKDPDFSPEAFIKMAKEDDKRAWWNLLDEMLNSRLKNHKIHSNLDIAAIEERLKECKKLKATMQTGEETTETDDAMLNIIEFIKEFYINDDNLLYRYNKFREEVHEIIKVVEMQYINKADKKFYGAGGNETNFTKVHKSQKELRNQIVDAVEMTWIKYMEEYPNDFHKKDIDLTRKIFNDNNLTFDCDFYRIIYYNIQCHPIELLATSYQFNGYLMKIDKKHLYNILKKTKRIELNSIRHHDEMLFYKSYTNKIKTIHEDAKFLENEVKIKIKEFNEEYEKHFKARSGYTIDDIPDMFILMLHAKHIEDKKIRNLARINIFFKNMGASNDFQEHIAKYYNEFSPHSSEFTEEAIEKFNNVLLKLIAMRIIVAKYRQVIDEFYHASSFVQQNTAGDTKRVPFSSYPYNKTQLDILQLDMYLNDYLGHFSGRDKDTISRMSLTRQIGGMFNFTLFIIYMNDYVELCFYEKIKLFVTGDDERGIGSFKSKGSKFYEKSGEFLMSPKIINGILNLPKQLAGINDQQGSENYINTENDDEEVVEHFVDAIIKIGQAFVGIAKVVTSIIDVITDPIKFIFFLIGWILSVVLLLAWIVLVVIIMVLHLPWAVYAIYFAVFVLYWVTIFLLFGTIYFILSLLDSFTGGAILKFLRCENFPSAWHEQPNWHKDNVYTRSFFCTYPCAKRYEQYSFFCKKQNSNEPIFTPQQIIYNTYKRKAYITSAWNKMHYEHVPKLQDYVRKSDMEKMNVWTQFINDKKSYHRNAKSKFFKYNKICEASCSVLLLDPNIKKDDKEKIKTMCKNAFCYDNIRNNLYMKANAAIDTNSSKSYMFIAKTLTYIITIIIIAYVINAVKVPAF